MADSNNNNNNNRGDSGDDGQQDDPSLNRDTGEENDQGEENVVQRDDNNPLRNRNAPAIVLQMPQRIIYGRRNPFAQQNRFTPYRPVPGPTPSAPRGILAGQNPFSPRIVLAQQNPFTPRSHLTHRTLEPAPRLATRNPFDRPAESPRDDRHYSAQGSQQQQQAQSSPLHLQHAPQMHGLVPQQPQNMPVVGVPQPARFCPHCGFRFAGLEGVEGQPALYCPVCGTRRPQILLSPASEVPSEVPRGGNAMEHQLLLQRGARMRQRHAQEGHSLADTTQQFQDIEEDEDEDDTDEV
ncbi:MAG: hypothetical protein Q9184_002547 [Pyrenodesmia sp. 2 TL-2023]